MHDILVKYSRTLVLFFKVIWFFKDFRGTEKLEKMQGPVGTQFNVSWLCFTVVHIRGKFAHLAAATDI